MSPDHTVFNVFAAVFAALAVASGIAAVLKWRLAPRGLLQGGAQFFPKIKTGR